MISVEASCGSLPLLREDVDPGRNKRLVSAGVKRRDFRLVLRHLDNGVFSRVCRGRCHGVISGFLRAE